MITFEIEGKEYELKLTFKSVQHLNSLYSGGAMEVIGKAFLQDLDLFARVVHAALFHTKENISYKKVEETIEEKFNNEELDADYISKVLNAMVIDHFFYKKTVEKVKKADKRMAEVLDMMNE